MHTKNTFVPKRLLAYTIKLTEFTCIHRLRSSFISFIHPNCFFVCQFFCFVLWDMRWRWFHSALWGLSRHFRSFVLKITSVEQQTHSCILPTWTQPHKHIKQTIFALFVCFPTLIPRVKQRERRDIYVMTRQQVTSDNNNTNIAGVEWEMISKSPLHKIFSSRERGHSTNNFSSVFLVSENKRACGFSFAISPLVFGRSRFFSSLPSCSSLLCVNLILSAFLWPTIRKRLEKKRQVWTCVQFSEWNKDSKEVLKRVSPIEKQMNLTKHCELKTSNERRWIGQLSKLSFYFVFKWIK